MKDPNTPLIVTLPSSAAKELIKEMTTAKPVNIEQKTLEAEQEFINDLKRAGTYELFLKENGITE